MSGQWPAIAGPQFFQALTAIAANRFIMPDADAEDQPLDPVDVPLALLDQHLALPANPAAILILDCGHTNHRADARLTAHPCHQRAD